MSEQLRRKEIVATTFEEKDTYLAPARCTNCTWSGTLEIERGRRFDAVNKCPHCACNGTLVRIL